MASTIKNKEMETMIKERQKATFDVTKLIHFLNGGEEQTKLYDEADFIILRDTQLIKKNFFELSQREERELTFRQIKRFVEISRIISPELASAVSTRLGSYDKSFQMRKFVHETLFHETIMSQGTIEQYQKYRQAILDYSIIGCFAMTELGHSSFLRGIETTATFDKKTQEFEILSPTLTSTKWWIGGAGQMSTHTVVLCQLISEGQNYGLHWFLVPLRNPDTGDVIPNVTLGHLGPKMGRNGLDNGYIQFLKLRIPLDHMLSRWAQISPEGNYSALAPPEISYSSLIGERFGAVAGTMDAVSQAVTIVVRYSAVRRQGPSQILDYQSHQFQLMPVLSSAIVLRIVGRSFYIDWKKQISLDNLSNKNYLTSLQDNHGCSAGLKAWMAWWGTQALETCRRAMGGHGYSAYNAISRIIGDHGVYTTGGGDNMVLAQQCSRYLIQTLGYIKNKKITVPHKSLQYFNRYEEILANNKLRATSPEDLLHSSVQAECMEWLSVVLTENAINLLNKDNNKAREKTWNDNMMDCINCSYPHTILYVFTRFNQEISTSSLPPNINAILKQCGDLFMLWHINEISHFFLEYGYFNANQAKMLRQQVLNLCQVLRVNAVPLVDSFNYADYILKAPVGCYDGNIYEKYFETVTKGEDQGKASYWNEVHQLLTARL